MSRLDLRASVTLDGTGGLKLTLRCLHDRCQELRAVLPERFEADGALASGTLILLDNPRGDYRVSYAGDGVKQRDDYVQLNAHYLGFVVTEPLAPVDVTATVEPGLVHLDAVPRDRWIPRAWADDVRVKRVLYRLAHGERADHVVRDLPLRDKSMLAGVRRGDPVPAVPPHVLLLARSLAP